MSHHLDSPTAREDGRVDIADVFIFAGKDLGTTVLVMTVNPLAGEVSPTTFRTGALYEFKLDNNGDSVEDLSYRISFDQPDANGVQRLEVRRAEGRAAESGSDGTLIADGRTGETTPVTEGGRIWAGLAADPFFFNLEGCEKFKQVLFEENRFDPSVFNEAKNFLSGRNVTTIVLEIPNSALGAETIHFWGTTAIPHNGEWVTINRAATPLMQEIFNNDEHLKDAYNKGLPRDDVATYSENIATFVAWVTQLAGTTTDPMAYGQRVARLLLPDVLTYNTQLPASYGFAGLNGRALSDDVGDVILSIMANMPFSDGVGKESKFGSSFPYLAQPNMTLH